LTHYSIRSAPRDWWNYAFALIDLAQSEAGPAVKMAADKALDEYATALEAGGDMGSLWIADRILAVFDRPLTPAAPSSSAKKLPPGSPIGTDK